MIVLFIILSVLFAYLAFNTGYLFLFAVAGLFRRKIQYPVLSDKKRIAVLIPAYQEDNVIIDTAQSAVKHNYASASFEVIVIADGLKPETITILSRLPIRLVKVSFSNSTKAKSLKAALAALKDDHFDIAMILDADNIMGPDCLERVNTAFHKGFRMVQLHRTAKNKNTPTAVMDALSEEINNHIFRKGHRALGISSALIGSGMAFDYSLFDTLMNQTDIENNPGEDREIYLEMLRRGEICEYIEDALVFDEKVQSNVVLEKQRTRWLSAQLQYARRFWIKELFGTFSYNIHYFDYALQTLLLPRVMLIAVSWFVLLFVFVLYLTMGIELYPGLLAWGALFVGSVLSLLVSAYKYFSAKEAAHGLWNMPKTLWSFFKATLKSTPNQKEFVRTPKEFVKN